MAATRTQGITVDTNGNFTIDKEHRGVRICLRLGPLSQEDAERRLDAEIARVESELEHKAAFRPRFADCAARYLAESQHKRSVSVVAWHIHLLYPYLGNLEVNRVHDRTLEPFIVDRMAAGVTATTINRSLEVVRTILNHAARAYRDDDGRPWWSPTGAVCAPVTQASDTPDRVFADHSGPTSRGTEYVDAFQLYKPLAGFRKPVGHGQSASAYRNLMLMQRLADFRNQVAS